MKTTTLQFSRATYLFFVFISLMGITCNKDKQQNEISLPPATQTGANTFGFLLNGIVWTPNGNEGGATPNLSIQVDLAKNQGTLSILAYGTWFTSKEDKHFNVISLVVRDSLNLMQPPAKLPLMKDFGYGNKMPLYGLAITYDPFPSGCPVYNQTMCQNVSGELVITKLDKINRIVAGTFTASLVLGGCGTVNIREGRFDMKF